MLTEMGGVGRLPFVEALDAFYMEGFSDDVAGRGVGCFGIVSL